MNARYKWQSYTPYGQCGYEFPPVLNHLFKFKEPVISLKDSKNSNNYLGSFQKSGSTVVPLVVQSAQPLKNVTILKGGGSL